MFSIIPLQLPLHTIKLFVPYVVYRRSREGVAVNFPSSLRRLLKRSVRCNASRDLRRGRGTEPKNYGSHGQQRGTHGVSVQPTTPKKVNTLRSIKASTLLLFD